MVVNQAYLFLIFSLNGVFIGLLFDFFRILRKSFKTGNLITYIEDVLFWILTGISIIFCMYKFSMGQLRLFMFMGLCFGIILYMLTLSKIIIKEVVLIISILKKFIKKIIKIIIAPIKFTYKLIKKIIIKPIYIFYNKIYQILTKRMLKINYRIKSTKKNKKKSKSHRVFEGFWK